MECQCMFCNFRRAIDVKAVLESHVADGTFMEMIRARAGDVSNPDVAKVAIGAMIHDSVPLAAEILARLEYGRDGNIDLANILPANEVEALAKLLVSFCVVLNQTGMADIDRGKELQQNVISMLKAKFPGEMEHGSSRLQ